MKNILTKNDNFSELEISYSCIIYAIILKIFCFTKLKGDALYNLLIINEVFMHERF